MPFERFEGRSRSGRAALMRRVKLPAVAIVGCLAVFALYERSYFTRTSSSTPATNMGWQSFLPAYNSRLSTASPSTSSSTNTTGQGAGFLGDSDYDDWWDDDFDDDFDGFAPEPTAEIWDPFIQNSRPLTEVTAKACVWPPSIYDACMPESSYRQDAERGQWIRVEKDLNMRVGVYYLYLFYRRLPLYSTAPTLREFRLLTKSEEKTTSLSEKNGWTKVAQNMRDGIWPSQEAMYLYYRTAPRNRSSTSMTDEINEIDVVWGSSGTLYGWERMNRDFAEPKEKAAAKQTDEGAELMWRKGSPKVPQAILPLSFSTQGNYKIMQIADLHFSVSKGKCLDSDWPGCKDPSGSDSVTLQWLGQVLDAEKPDLVILSGDQLNGQDTSYSSESVILKVAKLFEQRSVPWAAVLGNHDDEKTTLTRYGQIVMMQALPYFVGEPGPIQVDGEGNYVIKLYSADESRTVLFTLYFLDSHAYKSSLNPWNTEYDSLKESQIKWFKNESSRVKPIQRPYKPPKLHNDTFGLLDGIGSRVLKKDRLPLRQAQFKKPNAMAIFHIPLPEVYDSKPDIDTKSKSPLVLGELEEGRGAPKKNSGFFEKALLAQTEIGISGTVDAEMVEDDPDYAAAVLNAKPEVKVVLNGHCHLSDSCRRIKGVWSCFAGGSSYSGYGRVGFDRRVRIYQISDFGETISTYKIVDEHSDKSGNATASHMNASQDGQSGAEAEEAAVEAMLEAEADYLEGQLQAAAAGLEDGKSHNLASRQQPFSPRRRIDEQVLVGKGAPA